MYIFINNFQQDAELMNLDRFLVYEELYREVRDAIARATLSGDTDELVASLEVNYKPLLNPFGMFVLKYLENCL